jgi:hypothetical protein
MRRLSAGELAPQAAYAVEDKVERNMALRGLRRRSETAAAHFLKLPGSRRMGSQMLLIFPLSRF